MCGVSLILKLSHGLLIYGIIPHNDVPFDILEQGVARDVGGTNDDFGVIIKRKQVSLGMIAQRRVRTIMKALIIQMTFEIGASIHQSKEALQGLNNPAP